MKLIKTNKEEIKIIKTLLNKYKEGEKYIKWKR